MSFKVGTLWPKTIPRVWHQKVENELKELGYQKSKYDSCIFTKMQSNSFNVVALHVDDFLIFSNNNVEKFALKKHLMSKFSVKDLGEAKCCVGLNIERSNGKVKINQKSFIKELLKKYNMMECKPVSTPMEPNFKLSNDTSETETCKPNVPYQSLI